MLPKRPMGTSEAEPQTPVNVERYVLHQQIAAGGMATVHIGRLRGPAGFGRTVAIKRLHAHLAKEPELIALLMDEARIAARLRHPNVIPIVDVVQTESEALLVMEYVHGLSLARILKEIRAGREAVPPNVAATILCEVLRGLHAAHETVDEIGNPLGIVHRDISPQNILVGADGVSRVADFGIAKAVGRITVTQDGRVRGKLGYMSPEQLSGESVDRRTDIFAAGIVLWEMLTGRFLFLEESGDVNLDRIFQRNVEPPSQFVPGIPPALDEIVLDALQREPRRRFPTAKEFGLAIERSVPMATASEVSTWVETYVGDLLEERWDAVQRVERSSSEVSRGDLSGSTPSLRAGTQNSFSGSNVVPRKPSAGVRWPYAVGGALGSVFAVWVLLNIPLAPPSGPSLVEVRGEDPMASSGPRGGDGTPVPASPGAITENGSPVKDGLTLTANSAGTPSVGLPEVRPAPSSGQEVVEVGTPPASSGHATKESGASKSRKSRKKNCNPPYEFDADGVKHYKEDCL